MPPRYESKTIGRSRMLNHLLHRSARLLFGKLLPERPYPIVRGPLRGCRFILRAAAGEAGGVSVHLGRVEPAQTRRLIELLRPGDVCFDVGANVGYYTLLASRIVGRAGRVLAIEPASRNLTYLRRHIRLNRCLNVTVMPIACAEVAGVEAFAAGHNAATGYLASPSPSPRDGEREKEFEAVVTTEPLDLCAQRLHLMPHVIKIDVEGAELRVLRGATHLLRTSRPHLLLSTHSDPLRDECLRFLAGFDYLTTPLDASAAEFSASPRT